MLGHRFRLKRKKKISKEEDTHHGELPPLFRPSMVMPSLVNASTINASLAHASHDAKKDLVMVSQDIEGRLTHASPSWFREKGTIPIDCEDWNGGEIFDWYKKQRHTTISKLELRKERDHFKHEYIVVYLDDDKYRRIERRPIKGANTETISKEGCEAEDSLTLVSAKELETIHSETDAEIILEFHSNKPDLYSVIAAAVAIHLDPQTRKYTLQEYNCYFVARSIIVLVTRYCLLQAPATRGLRWDNVTESAILDHIFDGNWVKLDAAMKTAVITVLEKLLWGVIENDAGTRIDKKRDWDRLGVIMREVIRDQVEKCPTIRAGAEVREAVNEWIMHATQATLWYENLDQGLSNRRFSKKYETAAESSLTLGIKPGLETNLPNNMVVGLGEVLPVRLINRIPRNALAKLPPDVWGRIPRKVLERFPDDLIAKWPSNLLQRAPNVFLQNLPPSVISKLRDDIILALPDDLDAVPPGLFDAAVERMQHLLDQPERHPNKGLALRLLQRLPADRLVGLKPEYLAMCEVGKDNVDSSPDAGTTDGDGTADQAPLRVTSWPLLSRVKRRWDEASFVGAVVNITPIWVLKRVPPFVMDLIPKSWLRSFPTSALERIPAEYLANMTNHCYETLPQELLQRAPETLLLKLPRPTLERLPTSLIARLPEELMRNIPSELLENLPEDLTNVLRQVIESRVFEGEELKQELRENVKDILRQTLFRSSSELSTIQVSVKVYGKKATIKHLALHETLQKHILDMIAVHSKMVGQTFVLGMSAERVDTDLRRKTEEIWQEMRLHPRPSLPGLGRLSANA